jgi:hypothetical protein
VVIDAAWMGIGVPDVRDWMGIGVPDVRDDLHVTG